MENGGEPAEDPNFKCDIKIFDTNCHVWLQICTSCDSEEVSHDLDEGTGGLWTAEIAEGWSPVNADKRILKAMQPDGSEVT